MPEPISDAISETGAGAASPTAGVELARLAAPAAGALRASFGGAAPVEVRTVVGLDPAALVAGASVLAVRVAGEAVPVVIGVVDVPGVTRLERAVDFTPSAPDLVETAEGAIEEALEVEADGRRMTVEAADELVLRCGEASITLRADGKVVVRGTHILSHSTGPHRLKGGSVSIN